MRKVKKITLLIGLLFIIACGNNVEKDSTKILVVQNDLITKYKKEINEIETNPIASIAIKFNGPNWRQDKWDKMFQNSALDSLKNAFKESHGEDEYNVLSLKISDNFEKKMN